MNVACSGLAISAKREEWERLGGDSIRLRNGMGRMWELFRDAPVLGSLVEPRHVPVESLYVAGFEEVRPMVERALSRLDQDADPEQYEMRVVAGGIATAAAVLMTDFTLVATNVPYLKSERQGPVVRDLASRHYGEGKADLATIFMLRSFELVQRNGSVALVAPQSWLFLPTYRALRKHLLANASWNLLARLGQGAFSTITGEVVQVTLVEMTKAAPSVGGTFQAIDSASAQGAIGKEFHLRSGGMLCPAYADQAKNPDHRVILEEQTGGRAPLLAALRTPTGGKAPAIS